MKIAAPTWTSSYGSAPSEHSPTTPLPSPQFPGPSLPVSKEWGTGEEETCRQPTSPVARTPCMTSTSRQARLAHPSWHGAPSARTFCDRGGRGRQYPSSMRPMPTTGDTVIAPVPRAAVLVPVSAPPRPCALPTRADEVHTLVSAFYESLTHRMDEMTPWFILRKQARSEKLQPATISAEINARTRGHRSSVTCPYKTADSVPSLHGQMEDTDTVQVRGHLQSDDREC
ncbi:hypothetical protein BC827DRAFT_1384212 [Russula dissimulans]|nr:hypothetical protein BC827DRAFT_1384212 [Russula dissimulans]